MHVKILKSDWSYGKKQFDGLEHFIKIKSDSCLEVKLCKTITLVELYNLACQQKIKQFNTKSTIFIIKS